MICWRSFWDQIFVALPAWTPPLPPPIGLPQYTLKHISSLSVQAYIYIYMYDAGEWPQSKYIVKVIWILIVQQKAIIKLQLCWTSSLFLFLVVFSGTILSLVNKLNSHAFWKTNVFVVNDVFLLERWLFWNNLHWEMFLCRMECFSESEQMWAVSSMSPLSGPSQQVFLAVACRSSRSPKECYFSAGRVIKSPAPSRSLS